MVEAIDPDRLTAQGLEALMSRPPQRGVALLIVDDDRRVLEVSPSACELLGASASDLIGAALDTLIVPAMGERLENIWQAFSDYGGHAGPFQLAGEGSGERRVDLGVTSGVLPGHNIVLLTKAGERSALQGASQVADHGETRAPTSREREVLAMLASGATDGEIARKLSLSPATVQTHVRNAKAKLGARTRAQAVAVALRRGMISINS